MHPASGQPAVLLASNNLARSRDAAHEQSGPAQGADLNLPDGEGRRIVHAVCGYRVAGDRLAILRFLADHGADSKSPGKDGWPPIAEAMWWGHAQVLDSFAGQGVDLRAKLPGPIPRSTPGYTLFHNAAVQGNLACVRWLLEQGVPVKAQDAAGETPLLLAAEKGFPEVAKLLLEHGADRSLANKAGRTPLAVSRERIRLNRDSCNEINRVRHEEIARTLQ